MQPSYSQVPSELNASTTQEHHARSPEPSPNVNLETTQQEDGRQQEAVPSYPQERGQPRQSPITHAKIIDSELSTSRAPALFQPFWLRLPVLITLLVTFTIFWLILVILYRVASSEHGLSLTVTSSHYVWTYAPTVILTFVLSLWRQVDYYCKLTQPWRQMAVDPATPQHSMLLDYVSPMYAISLPKALRKGHIPVAVSITSFLLLKLVIVVSTGLLDATPTSHSFPRPVQLSSTFNASKIWDGIPDRAANVTNLSPGYHNVTTAILWAYLDQLNGQVPDVSQVKDGKIFQSFELLESSDNITSAHGNVDVFIPNVTCEAAQVKSPQLNMTDYYIQVEFESPSCSYTVQKSIKMWEQRFNSTSLIYSIDLADCSTDTNVSSETKLSNAQFAVSAVYYRNPIFPKGNFHTPEPDENTVVKANALLCKVDYSVQRADLRKNLQSGTSEVGALNDNATTTVDMTSTELSRYIYSSLDAGTDELRIETDIPEWTLEVASSPLFQLMYKYLGLAANNESFFDQATLNKSATSVFEGLVLQVGQSGLLQSAKLDSTGFVTVSIDRLQIRKAPLIVMIVSLALVTCLTLVIIFVVRKRVVPQKPGSIASYASILARSSTLQPLLENTGKLRTSELTRNLHGHQYQVIHSDRAFEIEASSGNQELVRTTKPVIKHAQWIPWAARIPLLALVFGLALLVIAILEVLQQSSNRNDGVTKLHNGDSDAVAYVIRYGSNLAALLVATLFNNLDFTITTLTPFHALRSGKASARESISLNLVGQIPLVALFKSLRYKHFGTSLSIFAAFVGSFLTIISSGLWVTDNQVLDPMKVTNSLGSSWDLTWRNNSADDAGASKFMNALDFGGAHETVGTWTNLALPTIGKVTTSGEAGEALSTANDETDSLQRYMFDIEGLRPELNCTVGRKEDIRYDETPTDAGMIIDGVESAIMSKSLGADFQLSSGCRNTDSKNSSFVTLNYTFVNDGNGEPSMIGNLYELNISSTSRAEQIRGSEGCPSLGILFGHFSNITALLCSQRIRSVPMTVTYSGDPATNIIDPQRPPVVSDNGPPKYMIDAPTGLSTFSYRVQQHFSEGLSYYPATAQDLAAGGHGDDLEPVFDHLIHGPYNTSQADILGLDHAQNLIVGMNKVYNKYMVQVLNTVLRSSGPGGNSTTTKKISDDGGEAETEAATVDGTLTRQITRLRMNNASKLTLQIMLAVMIVLSGIAVRLVKIRGTLPRDPYSIASIMGFLAGSEMTDPKSNIIPPGSEFLSSDALTKVFDERKFRLGWWYAGRTTVKNASQQQRNAYSDNKSNDDRRDGSPAENPDETLLEKQKDRSRFGIDVVNGVGSPRSSVESIKY